MEAKGRKGGDGGAGGEGTDAAEGRSVLSEEHQTHPAEPSPGAAFTSGYSFIFPITSSSILTPILMWGSPQPVL